jgi:TPP-dependent pyruvate/acetoin dehydrogenase alpha subunit
MDLSLENEFMNKETVSSAEGFFPTLGGLSDPSLYQEPLDLGSCAKDELLRYLRLMVRIRTAEEKIGDEVTEKRVKCPCHLVIGQEAPPVSLSSFLRDGDKVFGAHRSHAHFLALGGSLYVLFCEVQGKDAGCSRGMGGSMHLMDRKNHLYGTVPIVGATIPIATGAGLAAKLSGKGELAVSFLGDGAAEEGVFHESLNLASTMKLPVLFVCENNLYSSHMHISLRQPSDRVARFAQAHHVPNQTLDGNDVVGMAAQMEEAVEHCRTAKGPYFIEAVTYRWRGHVGPGEDFDVGVERKGDLEGWRLRDPIGRLAKAMLAKGMISLEEIEQVKQEEKEAVKKAWLEASEAEFPPASALLDRVYTNVTERDI